MKNLIRADTSQLQQIRKLTEVSRVLTYAASVEEVFQLTVDHATDLLDADKSLLMIADGDSLLTLRASHGVDPALAEGFSEPMSETIVPRIAALLGAEPERFLGVPLVVAGAIKGILVVIRTGAAIGEEQDEWFLSALADQAALALEKTRLDEVAEFREQLIGIVGHDLRNPLSTVSMAAQLLLERQGVGAYETEIARRISRSASLAMRLIDQLLDLTQSRLGGGIPLNPAPVLMKDIVRQVVGEMELIHPDRPLRVEMRGDLNGVWDRDRLYQLLANLVGNAMQHGEQRSPVDIRIQDDEREVVIEVSNRGEPIPPAMLPFIFDAYRQGRTGYSVRAHGLGLGLFIAKQIVHAHGGSITVTSSASDGTTFQVRLPRGKNE